MGTNTGIGIGIGIPFKNNALGGDRPYLPPELKARLIGVWDNYGKKNTDVDRNIIKNKIPNAGGDLEILNSAYKLNSGFGEYKVDFTVYNNQNVLVSPNKLVSIAGREIISLLPYVELSKAIPSYKIKVIGLIGELSYWYRNQDGSESRIIITKDGIYQLPTCYNVENGQGSSVGFNGYSESSCTIEQIPAFEGALVTDGINDLIISQKTVREMIGDNDEITVISMIYYINTDATSRITITNDVRGMTAEDKSSQVFARNGVSIEGIGKLGIYGWTKKGDSTTVYPYVNILGDKNDYNSTANYGLADDAKFCPVGEPSLKYLTKQAHYWSFMVIGKLTEDEINLIIAKYNLDRTLRPDILCNITKQGITNDNHADFNDKLVDYSGNGRDIQMYNLAWKGGSGIAAKKFETIKDYSIIPDEGTQELTIYNEFSYKIKSNMKDRYWAVQTLNKTDVSYPITIVSDKDIIWRNAINYTDENGVKRSIRKETNVPANTPTQVFVLGFNDFDVPDNYTKVNCVAYATRTDITEFTVTFIPSCKGGILLDGIEDFGKVTGMPIYKDYTFIIDRKFLNETFANQVCLASKSKVASEIENGGAFIVDNISVNSIINPYSFYKTTSLPGLNIFDRQIVFQSKYKYLDKDIAAGTATDSDTLWLGTFRDNDERFANVAIYSLMSFPYSMSEFLIERQLKKHKLGTLYPDMVEFRPVITINGESGDISYANDKWENINIGDYINIGEIVHILLYRKDIEEISNVKVNGAKFQSIDFDSIYNHWNINIELTSKSPQKINITIDEYIRYEDIVHPYPVLLRFNDENGNEVSWGGKFRIGSTITRIGSIADPESNLLNGLYSVSGLSLNGKAVTSITSIVEKQMVFKTTATYLLDNNEPKCILSPSRLRIPNSSYKLLGYIPDISGHGNHGVIHNSAYAEESGVNEDGSYQLDGVNDFITIPTVSGGGKQVFMKINNNDTRLGRMIYDQRSPSSGTGLYSDFAIYTNEDTTSSIIAYQSRLSGNTYIDGILNTNITCKDLQGVLQNITITCDIVKPNNGVVPYIGTGGYDKNIYGKFALYDYILFDNISTDDKIKELNEYVGIEAKVELPPYYWDAYGKTNLDADKATIQQRGVAVGDYDLTNYNHAYDKMSGYGGYEFAKFDKWSNPQREDGIEVIERNAYSFTAKRIGTGQYFWDFKNNSIKTLDKELTVKAISNKNTYIRWEFKYRTAEKPDTDTAILLVKQVMTPNVPITVTLPYKTEEEQAELGVVEGSTYYLFYFDSSDIPVNEEYTVEMLPLYPNGLVYDGISDYSENVSIPIFDDFTFLVKASLLNGFIGSGGAITKKGSNNQTISGGYDFVYALDSSTSEANKNSYWSFGKALLVSTGAIDPPLIGYMTKTNVNGVPTTTGTNPSIEGITFSKWLGHISMILYKAILYPKTIPLLQINFLKNLMERDEIIDLDNPIFKK